MYALHLVSVTFVSPALSPLCRRRLHHLRLAAVAVGDARALFARDLHRTCCVLECWGDNRVVNKSCVYAGKIEKWGTIALSPWIATTLSTHLHHRRNLLPTHRFMYVRMQEKEIRNFYGGGKPPLMVLQMDWVPML